MSRTPNPKEPQWNEEQRQVVRRFFGLAARLGLNQADMARVLRVSTATISQMRNEKYTGAVGRITERMSRTMSRWRDKLELVQPVDFVQTGIALEVQSALRLAHVRGEISVILGPAGVGKTQAAQQYCKEEPETLYVICGPGASPKPILTVLAGNLKEGWHGTQYQMRQKVVLALAGSEQLIIFDDVDLVPETTLQHLRLIHDQTRVGMAFLATPAYLARLKEKRSQTINQFLSRVGLEVHLGGCSDEDIEMIAAQFKVDAEALEVLRNGADGQARRAVKALQNAVALNGGAKVSARSLQTAFRQLPRLL